MKRRVVKKWINRYITPLIKDLPTTTFRGWEIKDNGYGMEEVHEGLNHTIVDGYIKPEGEYARFDSNKLRAIKRTAQIVIEIKRNYKHVYLRWHPDLEHGHIYMRLITEKVNNT